jgi:hypothetical protein
MCFCSSAAYVQNIFHSSKYLGSYMLDALNICAQTHLDLHVNNYYYGSILTKTGISDRVQ